MQFVDLHILRCFGNCRHVKLRLRESSIALTLSPRVWGSRVKTSPTCLSFKTSKHICKAYWIVLFNMNLLSEVHFPVFQNFLNSKISSPEIFSWIRHGIHCFASNKFTLRKVNSRGCLGCTYKLPHLHCDKSPLQKYLLKQ